jgi:hypothetical protein
LSTAGDVLHSHAELLAAGGGGADAAAPLLQRALDEGYLRALRLSRGDTDAQCGVAEVKLSLARLAAAAGDAATATHLAGEAADAYAAALTKPEQLGSVADRAEVAYNFACAAANCGAHSKPPRTAAPAWCVLRHARSRARPVASA